jgi:hypothetical protein
LSLTCREAILSHTWGNEEVLFSDIKDVSYDKSSTASAKLGYSKLINACQKAKEFSLDYCWIDTCCIDKDSSAELSEAINSMFAWYSDATVCFAYLEDVQCASVDVDLPNSRWFKRGWTLQELIAPKSVEFHDKDWVNIGSKYTRSEQVTPFMEELKSITGIDEVVLWKPAYMRSKSVAARMSWAQNRETTRKEDLAYCLMGIFGVNMPLLYGEGDRAFLRLQEEIIKISDDHSIFAWDRDPSGSSAVSCLARHPSWFERGAYVVPFGRKQSQSTSYAITNQGVQITLPLFQNPVSKVVYGLIDCHWANTLTGCIGIPLQGTMKSLFFERSSRHQPEEIVSRDMKAAKANEKRIFLSTRPVVEFPFAAEVTLQLYDRKLACGFAEVEVMDNPMHSHRWHEEYESFALRWPSTGEISRYEAINLLWRHQNRPGLCLLVRIRGKLEDRLNDGLGHFKALSLDVSTDVDRSMSRASSLDYEDVESKTEEVLPLESRCCVTWPGTSLEIVAKLETRDIFGNEVSILEITESSSSSE